MQKLGDAVAAASGGDGEAINARARNFAAIYVHLSVIDKRQKLCNLQSSTYMVIADTLYVGDEVNDLTVRDLSTPFIAPANAVRCVRPHADVVLTQSGGNGCIRHLADEVVRVLR